MEMETSETPVETVVEEKDSIDKQSKCDCMDYNTLCQSCAAEFAQDIPVIELKDEEKKSYTYRGIKFEHISCLNNPDGRFFYYGQFEIFRKVYNNTLEFAFDKCTSLRELMAFCIHSPENFTRCLPAYVQKCITCLLDYAPASYVAAITHDDMGDLTSRCEDFAVPLPELADGKIEARPKFSWVDKLISNWKHIVGLIPNPNEGVVNILMTIVDIISACRIIYLSDYSKEATAHAVSLLCSSIFGKDAVKTKFIAASLSALAVHFGHFSKDEVLMQEMDVNDILLFAKATVNSRLVTGIRNVVLSIVAMKWFSKPIADKCFAMLGSLKDTTWLGLLQSVLGALYNIFDSWRSICAGVSIYDVLAGHNDISLRLEQAKSCLLRRTAYYTGVPVEGKVQIRTLMAEVSTVSKALHAWLQDNAKSPSYNDVLKVHTELNTFGCELRSEVDGANRIPPICFIVRGPPQIGKSNVKKFIHHANADERGRVFDNSEVWSKCVASEYYEKYDPDSHTVIDIPELANKPRSQVDREGDENILSLISMIDNTRMALNQAAVDKKGMVNVTAEMITGDTNTMDLHAKSVVHCEAALFRRIKFVDVVPKKEFRTAEGSLDEEKVAKHARDNPRDRYNVWWFGLTTSAPTKNGGHQPYPIEGMACREGIDDIYRFNRVIRSIIRKHIARTAAAKKDMDDMSLFKHYDYKDKLAKKLYAVTSEKKMEYEDMEAIKDVVFAMADAKHWDPDEIDLICSAMCDTKVCAQLSQTDPDLPQEFKDVFSQGDEKVVPLVRAARPTCQDLILHAKQKKQNRSTLKSKLFWSWVHYNFYYYAEKFEHKMETTAGYLAQMSCFFIPTQNYAWFVGFMYLYFILGKILSVFFTLIGLWQIGALLEWFNSGLMASSVMRLYCYLITVRTHTFPVRDDAPTSVRVGSRIAGGYAYVVLALSLYGAYRATKALYELSTAIKSESQETQELCAANLDEEKNIGASESYKRIPLKTVADWNAQEVNKPTPASTDPIVPFSDRIRRNLRKVKVSITLNGMVTTGNLYCLGVFGEYALINRHAFGKGPGVYSVEMSDRSCDLDRACSSLSVDFCPETEGKVWIDLEGDAVLIATGKRFTDIVDCFVSSKSKLRVASCRINSYESTGTTCGRKESQSRDGKSKAVISQGFVYKWPDHKVGMCGLPVTVAYGGGSGVMGIHAAGGDGCGYAQIVTKEVLTMVKEVLFTVPGTVLSLITTEVEYEDPHPKSMFRYESLPYAEYFGKAPGVIGANGKSRVRTTRIACRVKDLFKDKLNFEPTTVFGPPPMQAFTAVNSEGKREYFNPYNIGVKKMCEKKKCLNPRILRRVVNELTKRICDGIGDRELKPLTLDVTVNGHEKDIFLRRIAMSTSIGPGFTGKKKDHFVELDLKTRVPTQRIKDVVNAKYAHWRSNVSIGSSFKVALKDEPRDAEKNKKGGTRMFYVAAIEDLLTRRQMLAPFYTCMVEKNELFGCSIGIDMHREGHKIYEAMVGGNIMEGDYSRYDLKMPFDVKRAVNEIIVNVLMQKGYNDNTVQFLNGVITDALFPKIEVLKDVFVIPGLQPSGMYATAEDNSLANLVLIMYAWYCGSYEKFGRFVDFFSNCRPVVYGDDFLIKVSPDHTWFNNLFYKQFCEDHYGLGLTPASKNGQMTPYVDIEDMSYLKRKFKYHPDHGRIVAYLDMNSILKTLMYIMPSSVVSVEEQVLGMVSSVAREISFHVSAETYHSFRSDLIDIVADGYSIDIDVVRDSFPVFDNLFPQQPETVSIVFDSRAEAERENETDVPLIIESDESELVVSDETKSETRLTGVVEPVRVLPTSELHLNMLFLMEKANLMRSQALTEMKSLDGPSQGQSWDTISTSDLYNTDPEYREAMNEWKKRNDAVADCDATIAMVNRWLRANPIFMEMDVTQTNSQPPDDTIIQRGNVTDMGGEVPETVAETIKVHLDDCADDHDEDYLKHPVLLFDGSYVISGDIKPAFYIDPYTLYFKNPVVRAKLRNYPYCSFKMEIVMKVTASNSAYGQYQATYIPHLVMNDITNNFWGLPAELINRLMSGMSQTQSGYIGQNKPMTFDLPFIFPKPFIRLYNNDGLVIAGGTNYADLTGAMTFLVSFISPVRVSSTATGNRFNIAIYARLKEVVLPQLTGTQVEIITESDERKTGPIERAASSAMAFSQAVSVVPVLEPWARASGIVSKAIRDVAAHHGWSAPTCQSKPERMKNEPFQNTATGIQHDVSQVISLDPLNELSVDPRVVGRDIDELSIASFGKIRTYIQQKEWLTTDPTFVPLMRIPVTPCYAPVVSSKKAHTPLSFVSTMFAWTRGTMKYLFCVPRSLLQRGELGIWWEPNIAQSTGIEANLDMNKQYMVIMDLQKTQQLEVCIHMAKDKLWLETTNGTIAIDSTSEDFVNGYLIVAPINRVQGPTTDGVFINVFVSGDVEFAYPTNVNIPLTMEIEFDEEPFCVDLNDKMIDDTHICQVTMGERIPSLRSLLRRYQCHRIYTKTAEVFTGSAPIIYQGSIIPPLFPNKAGTNPGSAPNATYLSWIRSVFLAWRGGMKFKTQIVGITPTSQSVFSTTKVALTNPNTVSNTAGTSAYGTAPGMATSARGSVLFAQHTNAGLEYSLPLYTPNLFAWAGTVTEPFANSGTSRVMATKNIVDYQLLVEANAPYSTTYCIENVAMRDDATLLYRMLMPFYTVA